MRPDAPAPAGAGVATVEPSGAPRVLNIANALTMARLALVPAIALTLSFEHGTSRPMRIASTALFLLAALTDHWDGRLARSRGLVTDFGKLADPIVDKALILGALIVLSALGELSWWVTGIIAVREIGVTILRFAVVRHAVIPASMGGKVKTVVQIIAIGLYLLSLPWTFATWICQVAMTAAIALTVATGIEYVVQIISILSAAREAGDSMSEGR